MNIKNILLSVLLFLGGCVQDVRAMNQEAMSLKDYTLQVLNEDDWVEIYLKGLARYMKMVTTTGFNKCRGCNEFYEKVVNIATLAYDSNIIDIRMRALNLYSALVAQNQAIEQSFEIIEHWLFASKFLDNEISHYRTLYLALAANSSTRKKLLKLANKASDKDGPLFRQEEAVKIYLAIKAQGKVSGSSSEAISGEETVLSESNSDSFSSDVRENPCYF